MTGACISEKLEHSLIESNQTRDNQTLNYWKNILVHFVLDPIIVSVKSFREVSVEDIIITHAVNDYETL
jgi:hypothetical protein